MEPVQFAPEDGTVQPVAEAEKIAAIVKAVVRAADAWGLSNTEAAALFDVPSATWSRMKAGTYKGVLDQDKVTRGSEEHTSELQSLTNLVCRLLLEKKKFKKKKKKHKQRRQNRLQF